jgi:hypothetical protein
VVIAIGLARRAVTVSGLALGALTVIVVVALAAATGFAVERLVRNAGGGRRPSIEVEALYLGAACSLSLLVASAIYRAVWHRIRTPELLLPVLGVWSALALATAILLRGASYLFVWPALVGLACLGGVLARAHHPRSLGVSANVLLASCTVPAVILLAPMIVLIHSAMGPSVTIGTTIGVALTVGLYVPALQLLATHGFWRIPAGAALVTATLIFLAIVMSPAGAVLR